MGEEKQRLMIVDDEPTNLQLLRQIFQDEYRLSFATSGQDALEVAAKLRPDVILLDIMMPGLDGYEVCRRLKADTSLRNIPVIFTTALGDGKDETKGFEIGAQDYITKPFNAAVVKARVRSIMALKEKTEQLGILSEKLSRYLSPQVCESIFSGERDVRIESQRKKLTIFFSDIVNFTQTTEQMEPEDLTHLLNVYFDRMASIAIKYGGTIDKFVGDAVMVFFGDPKSQGLREDALACVSMAMEMIENLKALQAEWYRNGVVMPFRIRAGINTGYCTVGNFGSANKMDYTIIGNQVNAAKRLQENSKEDQVIISHETWTHVKENVHCLRRKPILVKGITKPIQTYQVIGFHNRMERSDYVIPIRILMEKTETLEPDIQVRDINLGRRLDDDFNTAVVVSEGEPIGLIVNYHLTRILNSESHRARFFEQTVREVMDNSPLIVESDTPLVKVVQQVTAREPVKKYDPVIVTEEGRLAGIVSIGSLLEKMAELCENQHDPG